jgi:hypothetical protein
MEVRTLRVELLHADRRTDRHVAKLIVAFRNVSNTPKSAYAAVIIAFPVWIRYNFERNDIKCLVFV